MIRNPQSILRQLDTIQHINVDIKSKKVPLKPNKPAPKQQKCNDWDHFYFIHPGKGTLQRIQEQEENAKILLKKREEYRRVATKLSYQKNTNLEPLTSKSPSIPVPNTPNTPIKQTENVIDQASPNSVMFTDNIVAKR